jgi:hypothetical protein
LFMKKLLGIIALGLLFSGNAYAGVNEPGSGPIASINDVKSEYYENLAQVRKKNKHLITYISINNNVYASWSLYVKKIDEKSHEKAYKKCVKNAAKYTQEDCFIFAIDDKIVWNLDGPAKPKEPESAESKAKREKQAQLDKKLGRFFEDQPDVTDKPQVHFIYLLNKESKDNEWDVSGKMEKDLLEANKKMLKMTKGKQKFRYDMREDGKMDISFVRFDIQFKGDYGMNYPDAYLTKLGFNDPNKLYFAWVDVSHRDGGQGSVHHGYIFLKSKYNIGSNKRILITLHELMHVNGFAWACTKGNRNGHKSGTIIGGPEGGDKYILGSLYEHGDDTCPDFKDSVFLEPTSSTSFNPVYLQCARAAEVGRGIAPDSNYDWKSRYSHKKLKKIKKNRTWCTYNRYKDFN